MILMREKGILLKQIIVVLSICYWKAAIIWGLEATWIYDPSKSGIFRRTISKVYLALHEASEQKNTLAHFWINYADKGLGSDLR